MANHLTHILEDWYPQRDDTEWVLGTVYATEGSSYRKPGAMMLFGGLGQQLGLLSGGCLEGDIQRHGRRVMQSGESVSLTYDGTDEDDISFQLGIGCGGVVRLHLQPVLAAQQYLELDAVHAALQSGSAGVYRVDLREGARDFTNTFVLHDPAPAGRPAVLNSDGGPTLSVPVRPLEHLLIAGGGVDARPLCRMASELGWRVSVWDPRPANARPAYFESASHLVRGGIEQLESHLDRFPPSAAVIMTHNVSLDASVLSLLATRPLKYVALLGPRHRRTEVLESAGLMDAMLPWPFAGPAGLDLGGELPEMVALSILAESQAVLGGRQGNSFSLKLDRLPAYTRQANGNLGQQHRFSPHLEDDFNQLGTGSIP